jgi:hypothetical protein
VYAFIGLLLHDTSETVLGSPHLRFHSMQLIITSAGGDFNRDLFPGSAREAKRDIAS